MTRKNRLEKLERVFREDFKGLNLTDDELAAMGREIIGCLREGVLTPADMVDLPGVYSEIRAVGLAAFLAGKPGKQPGDDKLLESALAKLRRRRSGELRHF